MGELADQVRAAAAASLPPVDGELAIEGLGAPVEVLRDAWGVPDLYASTLEDLFFAQGFVSASERLFQIDLALRAATGRLSELFGDLTLATDRLARVVGLSRIAAAEAERHDSTSRMMTGRFSAGVHAWIRAMPAAPVEYLLLGAAPELPTDPGSWSAPFALAAWSLSGNWDLELLRARLVERLGPDAAAVLLPPGSSSWPAVPVGGVDGRLPAVPASPKGQGSNAWAVAGSRTASGRPLLANDPHLLVQQPGVWIEIGLHGPGLDVKGVAFPFSPGVVIGRTPHHAWGLTNVTGDVQDLYLERLSVDGTTALFDGAWEPVAVRRERIVVRGGDPVEFDVRETRHGPLLEAAPVGPAGTELRPISETYALRWTGVDGLWQPSTLLRIAGVSAFEGMRDAAADLRCPGQNVVYADSDGTIAYQCTGRYPIRRSGDGTVPVPGWTSEHEWDGWIPFGELPWSSDPDGGRVITANNRMHGEDYPHRISEDFHAPYRAARIAEILDGAEAPMDAAGLARIQTDVVSIPARLLLPRLLAVAPADAASTAALGMLRGWDGAMGAGSAAAAVFQAWVRAIAGRLLATGNDELDAYLAWREPFVCAALPTLLEEEAPPPWSGADDTWDRLLTRALADAVAELGERLGPDPASWRWGSLHAVRFAHPLARMPGLEEVFVAHAAELGGDEQTVMQAAFDWRDDRTTVVTASWRVVFDLADPDATLAVLPTGNSGNPASPHWNDQAPLWMHGRTRPFPLTRDAVQRGATSALVLTPPR